MSSQVDYGRVIDETSVITLGPCSGFRDNSVDPVSSPKIWVGVTPFPSYFSSEGMFLICAASYLPLQVRITRLRWLEA